MKKFFVLFSLTAAVSAGAHAQLAVFDAGLSMLMENSYAEQIVRFGTMIYNLEQQVENTYRQVEGMIKAEERALNNLKGINNIDSLAGFKNWYNSQLAYERNVENRFNNLNFQFGERNIRLTELESLKTLPDAAGAFFDDAWGGDLTEEQRKKMWTSLGLTPANYAYRQVWQQRELDLAKKIIAKRDQIEESRDENHDRHLGMMEAAEDENTDNKGMLQLLLAAQIELNNEISQMRLDMAEYAERDLAENRLYETPNSRVIISDNYGREIFSPITQTPGRYIE